MVCTSVGVGRFGGSSFGRSSFFVDGSMYCHTLLVLAVSCTTKNHWIQSDGLSRMMLTFDSAVVIIFGFGKGLIGVLAKTLF